MLLAWWWAAAAAAAAVVVLANEDLFFYLSESEPVCFLDDLAMGSTVLIKYKHPDAELGSKPVKITISTSDHQVVLEKRALASGRLAYAAKTQGEHSICASSVAGSNWPANSKTSKMYVKIDIVSSASAAVGEVVVEGNIAKVAHVKGLEAELNDLAGVVDLLLQDMELARERETHFRLQSERINSRVVWWSVAQTGILLLAAMMQSLHLHAFFVGKKMA
jgi:hypothetical protein